MMNVVWQQAAKFRGVVKGSTLLGSIILVSACTLNVQPPPVAMQQADLYDQDSDGVINARDACENTPLGAVINNDGCSDVLEVNEKDDLHILFANNSASIPQSYAAEVTELARFMDKFPQIHVELAGYASKVGSASYNLALSKRRANAVRAALIQQGVPGSRVKIVGYGDSDPVKAGSAQESEMLSRRVTASVAIDETEVVKKWTIYTSRQ